jgi:hypothetical protein
MQELTIRKANAHDTDTVYRMLCILSHKEHDRQRFEACYLRNITNVDIIYLIAEADGEVCGLSVAMRSNYCIMQVLHTKYRRCLLTKHTEERVSAKRCWQHY